MKNMKVLGVSVLAASVALAGCASTSGTTGTTTTGTGINKAVIGAVAGALGGAAISKATGGEKTGRDAAIGAVVGGAVGAYMQKQAKQIETQMAGTGVEVQQDPTTGNINLVMPGNITFAYDDATLNPSFTGSLNQLAQTMKEYNQTTIVVAGHTDSNGSDAYNYNLSQQRAASVANYLIRQGVDASRIRTVGYGEAQPVASNTTDAGRAQNRRVELTINAPQSL
ncbi:OmpA family protein [Moraxella sp. FZFQ2102]|uniref:OmpA family protein n=1 Tax=Moraxella sp. FZFQ2102 TaxID=2953752 RepID=UPI00209C0961|nr:OmpA family protein [Moraxella sp. FZFQ2102]USZ15487.1 OmpA family protein [Moraxella sp. FZFQ2102]